MKIVAHVCFDIHEGIIMAWRWASAITVSTVTILITHRGGEGMRFLGCDIVVTMWWEGRNSWVQGLVLLGLLRFHREAMVREIYQGLTFFGFKETKCTLLYLVSQARLNRKCSRNIGEFRHIRAKKMCVTYFRWENRVGSIELLGTVHAPFADDVGTIEMSRWIWVPFNVYRWQCVSMHTSSMGANGFVPIKLVDSRPPQESLDTMGSTVTNTVRVSSVIHTGKWQFLFSGITWRSMWVRKLDRFWRCSCFSSVQWLCVRIRRTKERGGIHTHIHTIRNCKFTPRAFTGRWTWPFQTLFHDHDHEVTVGHRA